MTESILRLVPPTPTDVDPLYELADKIRNKFAFADDLDNKAHKTQIAAGKARITAGQLLIEARDLCQQRGEPWEAWCKENICIFNRSLRDIRKVMALAGAPDPEAALEVEKETRREAMAKHRSHVGPVSPELAVDLDLVTLQAAVKALSTADFTAFKTWFFGYCGRS